MELKEGEYYYLTIKEGSFILKGNNNKNTQFDNVKIEPDEWYNKLGYFTMIKEQNLNLKIATNSQKQHFIACELANRFVRCPKEESIDLISNLVIW